MAKSSQHSRSGKIRLLDLAIITPKQGDTVCVADDGTIEVALNDNDMHRHTATISDFAGGSGSGGGAPVQLQQEGSTSRFSARVSVGFISDPPPAGNNKFLTVVDEDTGDSTSYPFRAIHCGSGSGSRTFLLVHRCPFCRADQPLPVAVRLQLDSPVAAGTCSHCDQLNQPTDLIHCQHPGFECCWLSAPIDFCADGAHPGFWMLQKYDAKSWLLLLRRGKDYVVTYRLTTAAEQDCSFPLRLELAGVGGAECKHWPQTVTIVPAP